jgi:UDP-N-acetyl-D-glucosamine/UDP-N-acetyl-D-galactosamine dehydrogenase
VKCKAYFNGISPEEVMHEYGITSRTTLEQFPSHRESVPGIGRLGLRYSVIILAVAHNEFLSIDLKALKQARTAIYDVKGMLDKELTNGRL